MHSSDLLILYDYISRLKTTKRRGWTFKNIPIPESVADHTFGVTLLTLLLADRLKFDVMKCVKMALIHDLGEAITDDITPHDNVNQELKKQNEKNALEKIFKETKQEKLMPLAEEYFESKTPESCFVHDIDKIEMVLQALIFGKQGYDVKEFYAYVENKLKLDENKLLFKDILSSVK